MYVSASAFIINFAKHYGKFQILLIDIYELKKELK